MVKMIVSARNNACLLSNYKRPERLLNKVKVDDDSIRSLDEKKPFVTSGQEHFWGKSIIVKACNQESSSWMEKQRGHNKVQTISRGDACTRMMLREKYGDVGNWLLIKSIRIRSCQTWWRHELLPVELSLVFMDDMSAIRWTLKHTGLYSVLSFSCKTDRTEVHSANE